MLLRRRIAKSHATRGRLPRLAAAAFALLVTAAPLPVSAARGAPASRACADSEALARETLRLLGDVLLDAPDARLVLEPVAPDGIRVRLHRADALVLERQVAVKGADCAELPHVIALLVRGGLRQPVHQLARDLVARPAAEAPREPVAAVVEPAPEPPPALPQAPRFRASVVGGVWSSFSRETSGAPTGIGAAEWYPNPRWGAALLIGVDGAATYPAGPGELSVSAWFPAIVGRLTLQLADATALDLLAGPSLHLLTAHTVGFPADFAQTRPAPSATALLRVRHALADNVEATAALGLTWRPGRDSYHLQGLDTVRLSPTRAALLLGIVWGFDRRI